MNVIMIVVILLSVFLVYSLLSINIQDQLYDLGVIKCLGGTYFKLSYIVLLNAFFYSLPAWVIGLFIAQLVQTCISAQLSKLSLIPIRALLTSQALAWATAVVLLVPIISSLFPLWTIFHLTLEEILQKRRSKTKAVEINIERNDIDVSVNTIPNLTAGVISVLVAFSIYYIFPLSLLSQDWTVMLYVLIFILLGFLFGSLLLTLNFSMIIQTILLNGLFLWETFPVKRIVSKNLVAHKIRNQQTTCKHI